MSIKTKLLDELIDSITPPKETESYNLVLDSGAFNGGYLIGCLLYIKEIEQKKYVNIEKISGSSIGSICGLLYLSDKLEVYSEFYSSIRNDMISKLNYKVLYKILDDIICKEQNDFYKKCNNKLFVTYFDIKKKRDVIVSNYKSNKHLYRVIKNSTYIPVIAGGLTSNNKIDATVPHIIYDKNKTIFLNLTTFKKVTFCLNVSEKNPTYKSLIGIIDIHQFYSTKCKTEICSCVNEWSAYENCLHSIRVILTYMIKYLIAYLIELKEHYTANEEEYKQKFIMYITNQIRNYILMSISY
jgi:hypothetical protein